MSLAALLLVAAPAASSAPVSPVFPASPGQPGEPPTQADDGAEAGATADAAEVFERGVEAYRRGAYDEAAAHWRLCLEQDLAPDDRARVAYDLGNAAWRREEPWLAIGWYTVALHHAPRHADALRNLELVRAASELEPADSGSLWDVGIRAAASFRPSEARLLAAAGLALLALALVGEALRGGRLWRRLSWAALALAVLGAVPWLLDRTSERDASMLVVRAPSVALRSEPRLELAPIGRVDAGAEVQRIDALTGWVRVLTADGERGWLQEEALFDLVPGKAG